MRVKLMWTQQAWCERIPNRTIEHQPGASAEASPKGGPIARQGYTRRVPNLTRAQGSCAVSICGGQAVSEVRTVVVCRGAFLRRRLEAPRGQKWSARDPRQLGRGRPARAPHCHGLPPLVEGSHFTVGVSCHFSVTHPPFIVQKVCAPWRPESPRNQKCSARDSQL